MKRLTLLIVLLVVVGLASGFALEVKPSFALTGSATLTWGIDLDSGWTGFTNAGSGSLVVTIMAVDGTDTHVGKGPIYGSITLSNVELVATDGGFTFPNAVGVAAQLFVPPFEIGVNAAPAMSSDSAAVIEAAALTGNATVDAVMEADTSFYISRYSTLQQGTYVKYAGTGFSVTADIVSQGGWTTNMYSGYAFGLQGSATFAPVTVGVGLFQGVNWTLVAGGWPANPLGGYVSTSVAIPMVGPAAIGFDWQLDGSVFSWEVSGSAQMNFNKEATAYLLAKLYYDPQGVTGADSALKLMIPMATLIGAINFDATFWLLDFDSATMDMALLMNAGYMMKLQGDMYVQPAIGVAFSSNGATAVNALVIIPKVVLGLAAAPATTLTFTYTSDDLLATPMGMGVITAALGITY